MSKYMIRTRIESGRWERVLPRTYRLVGVAGSFEQQLLAAALWCGGVASHESAAAVWALDGARKRRIEVTVDRGGSVTPVDWITVHRTNRSLDGYRTMRHDIPVTSIPRTLIELGTSVPRWRLQSALDHALRDGLTSTGLVADLKPLGGPGPKGAGRLRRLLEDPNLGLPPAARALKRRIIRRIPSRVPDPQRQFRVFDEQGEVGVLDFAWPDRLLGVEGDSWEHHAKRSDWQHDRTRRNRLTRLG